MKTYITRFFKWLVNRSESTGTPSKIIYWWEIRRIPYNFIVGSTAIISFVIYCIAIYFSGELKPGDDFIEPIAFFAVPFIFLFANICYTAGWISELLLRSFFPKHTLDVGPYLFIMGLTFSVIAVFCPAVFWALWDICKALFN